MSELIELPKDRDSLLAVFTDNAKLAEYYAIVEQEVSGIAHDMSTKKGRDQCASDAYKVSRTKTAVGKVGKELSAHYKDIPKKIDSGRNWWETQMDGLRDRIRAPLDVWEKAEKQRVEAHQSNIEGIKSSCVFTSGVASKDLQETLSKVQSIRMGDQWEEFEPLAARAKDDAIEVLNAAIEVAIKREQEAEELARLREEKAAQEKAEQERLIAEAAAKEAEDKAKREAQAAIEASQQREREAKEAAEKAEADRVAAIQAQKEAEEAAKAEREAAIERERLAVEQARKDEQQRQEAERIRLDNERQARERDTENKKRVNNEILDDLIQAGIDDSEARLIIAAIVKGRIRNVQINY